MVKFSSSSMFRFVKILLTLVAILLAEITFAQKFFEVEKVEDAQVKFYAVDDPKDADLLFCIIYEEQLITKTGIMMEVETPKEAQVLIIFVDDPALADIKVWLVEKPEEVVWKNESKRKLLSVGGLK